MGRLIKNEIIKLFAYKRMYIFLSIITLIVLMVSVVLKVVDKADMESSELAYLSSIANGQSLPVVMLDILSWFVIPMFIVVLVGFMISEEYGEGTLKLSLLHPISRSGFIFSKLVSVFIAGFIMLMYTAIITYVIGTLFLGFGNEFTASDGLNGIIKFYTFKGVVITFLSYILTDITLTAFASILFLIAINLSSSGAAIGAGIGLLVVVNIISTFKFGFNDFFVSGYLKFHNILLASNGMSKGALGIVVLFAYIAVFYMITVSLFNKKDILN